MSERMFFSVLVGGVCEAEGLDIDTAIEVRDHAMSFDFVGEVVIVLEDSM